MSNQIVTRDTVTGVVAAPSAVRTIEFDNANEFIEVAKAAPSFAPNGKIIPYAEVVAGRVMPLWATETSKRNIPQEAIWNQGWVSVRPSTTTAWTTMGTPAPTVTGTVSQPTPATGSIRNSSRRKLITSAATAGSSSSFVLPFNHCWRGDLAGAGGFFASFRFACATNVATPRFFVGLAQTKSGYANLNPINMVSGVGVGNLSGEANLSIFHNDTGGLATQIPLGSDFPVPSSVNNVIIDLYLWAAPNASEITYEVVNVLTKVSATGVLNTNLPLVTDFLAPHFHMNNDVTAAAVGLDVFHLELFTPT